jgi:ribbon-helix-helix CopG family protein
MRTTVTLEDDVAAAVERRRRERGVGVSQAVNDLVREGLRVQPSKGRKFRQRSNSLGLRVDVTNLAEALELVEGPNNR